MRIAFLVLTPLLIAALFLLAACGGGEPQGPSWPSGTPTPRPTSTPRDTTPVLMPTSGVLVTPTSTSTSEKPTSEKEVRVALGESLSVDNGCTACHSPIDRAAWEMTGPNWKGLYGKEEVMLDGTKVAVDDAYLFESITDPNAKIVEGYQKDLMPKTYGDTLSDVEIEAIIEYIKSLE